MSTSVGYVVTGKQFNFFNIIRLIANLWQQGQEVSKALEREQAKIQHTIMVISYQASPIER